jgi:hypothetical protein
MVFLTKFEQELILNGSSKGKKIEKYLKHTVIKELTPISGSTKEKIRK